MILFSKMRLKLRVAILSADYFPNVGGVAAHVHELSSALVNNGHEVDLLTLPLGKPVGIENHSGLNIHRVKSPKNEPFFTWFFGSYLRKYIKYSKPDVIHVHGMRPLGAVKNLDLPIVFTNHTSGYLKRIERGGRELIKIAKRLKSVDAVIAPSQELCDATRVVGYEKPVVFISNGVDTQKFRPGMNSKLREELGWVDDEIVILLARRLVEKNGVLDFAKAATLVKRSNARFLFAGDGDERGGIERILSDGGVLEKSYFLGNVQNSKMLDVYQSSDISVLPSYMEATSITGLESMACGLPLVGTRVGGIPFIIDNMKSGVLVNPRSPDSIAKEIQKLIDDSQLRLSMGKNGRMRAEQLFSWKRIAEETASVYESVI